jgi:hypothetical protein
VRTVLECVSSLEVLTDEARHLRRKGKMVSKRTRHSSTTTCVIGAQIFEVTTTTSDARLVVKLQNIKYGTMAREIDTYRKLQSERCANIAHVICSGEDQGNYAIVMPKYYMNLRQFFFSTPTKGIESLLSLTVFAIDMVSYLTVSLASLDTSSRLERLNLSILNALFIVILGRKILC